MNPLPPPDNFHLQAAQGWLELGNPEEAHQELARIAPELQTCPEVLEMRWHLYAHAQNWGVCLDVADQAVELAPERSDGWVHRSFALHELKRTEEALNQLLPALAKFPDLWVIPYNLACYCAQLGRLRESREWLDKARALDEATVTEAAAMDPDLKPLRESIGERPEGPAQSH